MKIFNKGSRKIEHGDVTLTPQKAVEVSQESGEKLMRLYGDELIDMDNVTPEKLAGVQSTEDLKAREKKIEREAAEKAKAEVADQIKTLTERAEAAEKALDELTAPKKPGPKPKADK
jgi:hypothetical protein